MSVLLVKKGLELLTEDQDSGSNTSKGKVSKRKRGKRNKKKEECLLEEYRKRHSEDKTKQNLKFLKMLDTPVSSEVSENMIKFNRGKLAKNQPVKEETPDEGTVFTEEDFESFEQDYFVKGKF